MDEVCISKDFGKTRYQRVKSLAVLGIVSTALYFLYVFNPASSTFYVPCPFHALTGLYCPGCGSLRAIHQLLHGHMAAAFGLNPLMILSLPFLGYCFLSYCLIGIRGRSLPDVFVPPLSIWIYLGVVLLFWIIRNISWYPFSWLAP